MVGPALFCYEATGCEEDPCDASLKGAPTEEPPLLGRRANSVGQPEDFFRVPSCLFPIMMNMTHTFIARRNSELWKNRAEGRVDQQVSSDVVVQARP